MENRDTFRVAVRKFSPFENAIRKQWAEFCETNGCKLRLDAEAFDLHPLHKTLLEEGGLCGGRWDVGFLNTDWVAEAHATGALEDLSPYLRKMPPEDYPGGWTDSLLRHQRFGGAVLGVPYHDGPECLIFRKDVFERLGEPPPGTWEEFHDLARRLTVAEENRWGTAFAAYPDGHNTVYDFCLQLWTRGGELFSRDQQFEIDTDCALEALSYYRSILNDAGAVHPKCREMDSVQSGLAFAKGEIAMMVNWFGFAALGETWDESTVKGLVGIAPLPSNPGVSTASLNVYWLLGIGSGSPHRKIAYDFLRYCASRHGDKLLTIQGGIGCRVSTWDDPDVNRIIPFYRELRQIHRGARELPRLAHWSEIAGIIDRLVTAAITTMRPIQELLESAQREGDVLAKKISTKAP